MDFSVTEDQKVLIKLVRDFVKKEIAPHILELDAKGDFPLEIFKKAWEMGLTNLCIPKDFGGAGIDAMSRCIIPEELSYGCSGIATSALCNDLANTVIAMYGTQEQKEKYLRPFTEKPIFASFCLTEVDAGSDNLAMSSYIKKREDGKYVLNGSKCFITNANYASQFTVICKLNDPHSKILTCLVTPREPEEGKIEISKPNQKLGQYLSNNASVTFDHVVVDPSQIIGERFLGFKYVMDVLDFARPLVASMGVGLAQRAYDLTLEFAKQRIEFGQRICDMPVVRESLVKMFNKVQVARTMTRFCLWKLKNDEADKSLYASLAKNLAAEAAIFNATEGLHLHGGYGFMREYEISKLARDAHILDIYEGVREIHSMLEARSIISPPTN